MKNLQTIFLLPGTLSMSCLILVLFLPASSLHLVGQQERQNYLGWNHYIDVGADLNLILNINPKIGQEGSQFRWGFMANLENIYIGNTLIFENKWMAQLGGFRNASDRVVSPVTSQIINPSKKSYDRLEWQSKCMHELSDEKHYIGAEHYFFTTMTPSYSGNYFKSLDYIETPRSSFLSPFYSTWSIGYEQRHSRLYSLYLAPIAAKILVIKSDDIASLPAINAVGDSVTFLGSGLHGNELEFDFEEQLVTSYKKSRLFLGAQAVFRYNKQYVDDKLSVSGEARIFFDYLASPDLDFNVRAEVRYVLFGSVQLAMVMDVIRDNNQFFQSTNTGRTDEIERTLLKRGFSYNQRFVIRYSFEK